MMPGARRVLVEVAPFPASTGAGYLGAAERACLLAGVAGCFGKRDISHLRGPLRCRLAARGVARLVCWPSVAAVPAAGYSRANRLRPAYTLPCSPQDPQPPGA